MLWISAITTALLFSTMGCCFAISKSDSRLAAWLLGSPLFLFFMFFALTMNLTASIFSGLVLVAAAAIATPPDTNRYLRRAAKGVGLVYAAVSISSIGMLYNRSVLRAAHPFDSLAHRTASRRHSSTDPSAWARESTDAAPKSDEHAGPVFTAFQKKIAFRSNISLHARRSRAIESLHQSYVAQFVNSFGFGVQRMPDPGQFPERYVDSNKAPSVPQPRPRPTVDPATPEGADPERTTVPPIDALQHGPAVEHLSADGDDLAALHLAGMLDFFNPNDFGYVKSVNEVAGFRPHHFKRLPDPTDLMEPERAASNWSVERLELVGLLLHEEPVVYVSDNLPKMEPGIDMPTRQLDAFEREAFRRLEAGEELATLQTGNHLRVLGAIRAAKECLKCHQVNRGDLLGAFSYRLRREPLAPVAKKEPGPKT